MFAVTSCDVDGPRPQNAHHTDNTHNPDDHNNSCTPVLPYPVDQLSLVSAFASKSLAREYLTSHWDTFVTEADIVQIKAAKVKNVRVPIGHWILDPVLDDDASPWVPGGEKQNKRRWCSSLSPALSV